MSAKAEPEALDRAPSWPPLLALAASTIPVLAFLRFSPFNHDEIEYARATRWVLEGRLPFRDFFEHHTPLLWYLMAPVAAISRGADLGTFLAFRAATVVLWVGTVATLYALLRRRGAPLWATLLAFALVLGSVTVTRNIVELRPDAVMGLTYVVALFLLETSFDGPPRETSRLFLAGAALALGCLAAQRMAPVAVLTTLLYTLIRNDERWGLRFRALWIAAGGASVAALTVGFFSLQGALKPLVEQTVVLNLRFELLARDSRFLGSLGFWLLGLVFRLGDSPLLLLWIVGLASIVSALLLVRKPVFETRLLVLVLVQLVTVARTPAIYVYHLFMLWWLLAVLIAVCTKALGASPTRLVRRIGPVAVSIAVLCASLSVSWGLLAKMQAYQIHVLERVHAVTRPEERVFDALGFALGREPAQRIWFLPSLVVLLAQHGELPPLDVPHLVESRPAAIVWSRRLLGYLQDCTPSAVRSFLAHNYLPLEPAIWIPAMSARLRPGETAQLTVIRGGRYRAVKAPKLRDSPFFVVPFAFAFGHGPAERSRVDTRQLPPLSSGDPVSVSTAGSPLVLAPDGMLVLRAGQTLSATNSGPETEVLLIVPIEHPVFFDQPFPDLVWDESV